MCIAICDSKEQRKYLKEYCIKYSNMTGVERTIIEFEFLKDIFIYYDAQIDLLFLDMALPGLDDIQIREKVEHLDFIWRIVFISNKRDWVFSAFGIKTLGFGMKPIYYKQFRKWLDIVLNERYRNTIIKFEEKNYSTWCQTNQIRYIEARGSYIHVHTTQTVFCVSKNIKYWEVQLKTDNFIRVHRSYFVNMGYIDEIKNNSIQIGQEKISVGRTYKKNVLEKYQIFMQEQVRRNI